MKLPAFDHSKKEWDRFKEFHISAYDEHAYRTSSNKHYKNCFVQFENGSMAITHAGYHNRQLHSEFRLAIGTPQELRQHGVTFLKPDGSKMPTSWLFTAETGETSSPTLVLDLDTREAYRCYRPWPLSVRWAATKTDAPEPGSFESMVPEYAKTAELFWPRPTSAPVCRHKVRVCPSARYRSDEQKEQLATLLPMARAIDALESSQQYSVSRWEVREALAQLESGEHEWERVVEGLSNHWRVGNGTWTPHCMAAQAVLHYAKSRPTWAQPSVSVDIQPSSTLDI